jgi:hypothetical protein
MSENKTSISGASSYREIGKFWDEHDLADYWDQTHEVQITVDIDSSTIYFPVEKSLADKLRTEAENRGVSPATLLNTWVQEHVGGDTQAK